MTVRSAYFDKRIFCANKQSQKICIAAAMLAWEAAMHILRRATRTRNAQHSESAYLRSGFSGKTCGFASCRRRETPKESNKQKENEKWKRDYLPQSQ